MQDQNVKFWLTINNTENQLIENVNSSFSSLDEANNVFDGLKSTNFRDYNAEMLKKGSTIRFENTEYKIVEIALGINKADNGFIEFHTFVTVEEI